MRTRQRRRRKIKRGGNTMRQGNYTYNSNPKLGYPVNTNVLRGGGKWYDMFDPRVRLPQSVFSAGDSLSYGAKSGYAALAGHYSPVNPDILKGQFQK